MIVGFNHNFRHKGTLYHVQTEDGGLKNPMIITHLFIGGTILQTKKTSYADILKVDRLEQVVEELMKEQHRKMLRQLRDGEFDAIIAARSAVPVARTAAAGPQPAAPLPPAETPPPTAAVPAEKLIAAPAAATEPESALNSSLDDIILSYLLGENGQKP